MFRFRRGIDRDVPPFPGMAMATGRVAVLVFVMVLLVHGYDLTTALTAAALYAHSRGAIATDPGLARLGETPFWPRRAELRITVRFDRDGGPGARR